MNKLLVISGPTATGKTALAAKLAKKFNGELISADSRQIYQGMDIGVGKDHPRGTPIHLIDIISPDQTFSVSEFRNLAMPVINHLQNQNKLPILVGGSGLYIDAIINPQITFSTKSKGILRFFLNRFSVDNLQKIYSILDKNNYLSLNNSDRNNPRRLIRKIEIALSPPRESLFIPTFDYLHLSLTAPNSFLYSRIDARVEERLRIGHLDELASLLQHYSWNHPGLKVSAYHTFKKYFDKRADLAQCVQKWKYLEHRDARRQKTWFKARENLFFFDISLPHYSKNITNYATKWYNKPSNETRKNRNFS